MVVLSAGMSENGGIVTPSKECSGESWFLWMYWNQRRLRHDPTARMIRLRAVPSKGVGVVIHPDAKFLNSKVSIPYGLTGKQILDAMSDFTSFLEFINSQLHSRGMTRFECMLMPANFSSMVGEFMSANIPKYCATLAKNNYHNGHPDLVPKGMYPNNSLQHGAEGIELKGSRYPSGWQGHNAETCWLMVFHFSSGRPVDTGAIRDFKFEGVYLGRLEESDWTFSGRKEGSRRTITASVNRSGFDKMSKNWVYKHP